jgi:hypothetical protein
MPFKFCRPLVGTTYTKLDNFNGQVNAVVNNAAGITVRFVGPAVDLTEANALDTAGIYMDVASNSGAVYTMSVDPSLTWIKTASGGGNIGVHFNW